MAKHPQDYEQGNPRLGYRVPKARRTAFAQKAKAEGFSPSAAINLLIEAYVEGTVRLVPSTVATPAWMSPPTETKQ